MQGFQLTDQKIRSMLTKHVWLCAVCFAYREAKSVEILFKVAVNLIFIKRIFCWKLLEFAVNST